MILAFFLFSNSNPINNFTINDLFEVKQGKQVLDKVKSNSTGKNEKIDSLACSQHQNCPCFSKSSKE